MSKLMKWVRLAKNNNIMEKKYSLISCRVSSEKQVSEGNGLKTQEQRCKKYSDEKGYIYEDTFFDEGISGAILERPAIKKMLEHIDKNPNKKYVAIFDDINRIARDIEVHWAIKRAFELRGATVESPNHKFEDTPEGKFIETILAGKSQLDREQNTRQVKQKMKARMEMGYYCLCQRPFGYDYKKNEIHGKLLSPTEPEVGYVKTALEGFANDSFLNQVDVLNFFQENKEHLKGRIINLNFVKRILSQIIYAGYIEYPRWEVSRRKGHHEAIIDLETFEKIQHKLNKEERKRPNLRDRIEFPLRRIVNCSICGKKMTGSKVKGKLKYYMVYTCNNKNCTAKPKNIHTQVLENEYIKLLNTIAPEKEIIELTEIISLDVWNKSISKLKSSEEDIMIEIKNKEKQKENFINLASKAKSEKIKEEYELNAEHLINEISRLKKQSSKTDNFDYDEAWDEVRNFLRTPAKYWGSASLEGKFMVHNLIFLENPTFNLKNGFGTPKISLPFAIKGILSDAKFAHVGREGFEPPKTEVG